jgi:2-hydroxycyclohexanecarboxyl-CoA dehydrogenase
MTHYTTSDIPRLAGRTALVTGAGGGIGHAISLRLAAEGAHVVCTDIDEAAAVHTASEVRSAAGRAIAVAMDITDFDAVRRVLAEVEASAEPLDVLVNNAGWDRMQPFMENTPEFWDRVIAVNLRGPIHCCRAVLDGMIARGRGKIISISSDAARVGSSGEAVYSACKGGIISFSKTLAREMARHRVNVNVVCPGPTDTALIRGMAAEGGEKIVEALVRAIPFRRMAEPEEIAAAVAFFASPDADFITGQVLSVNGGLTMVS